MTGDPPPELPLVPLIPLGALDRPGSAPPGAAAAFSAQEPRLFALAWLITGGHDGAAAHALAQARDEFATSWTGATDATAYARLLLVPRACRAARGVHPRATGIALLDQLLAVQPRARAALVLHEALGLDDPTTGQLLDVDQYEAASLQRHALGACRFKDVPELVRTTFDEQVARVATDGLPAATRPRTRRTPLVIGAIATMAVLAGLLTWHALHDGRSFTPADPSVTHYVALVADGWQRDTFDVATIDYGTMPRVYAATDHNGVVTARLVLLPDQSPPVGAAAVGTEQIGDHAVNVQTSASTDDLTARISAPCGNAQGFSYGIARADLVRAAATMRCEPDGSRRVAAPPGLRERAFRWVDHAIATTATYRMGDSALFLRAEPDLVESEIMAPHGARLVRRDGTRYIVWHGDLSGPNPIRGVRWTLGDAAVTIVVLADIDEAAVVTLAAKVRAIDEATFRADPPTTTR